MGDHKRNDSKAFVVASHKRCQALDISVDRIYSTRILDEKQLFERLDYCKDLIQTAEPFLSQLYNFVKGTDFFVLLTDKNGCILSIFGDEGILSQAFSYKMMPGAYMDEANIGTNAMGTAIVEGLPVQISGNEHYIKAYHRWTCSASPIRDSSGRLIGTLDLTGYSELVHPHTLGMVVAAANAIERMLEIKEVNDQLTLSKIYTDTIIDSIAAGIITVDLQGNIKTANKQIPMMFGYGHEDLAHIKAWELFEGWENVMDSARLNRVFVDEEVSINSRRNKICFNLSVYPIRDNRSNLSGIILVFKEVKKVRKLANRIMGRHAVYTFDKIVGQNEHFCNVMAFAKKVSDSRSTILIMGESGTGKELFAQAIHNHSNRREEVFIALNCGAIPRTLIESELFGYEEGAYTGAKTTGNPGKFEIADGGTIFLDEIGEMPLDMQTQLLRVIEEGTVSRIGGTKEILVDVRIIAASNRNLEEEVKKGNFRKDLYYRLNVLPLKLPALRQRKDDVPILVDYFNRRLSKRLNKKPYTITDHDLKAFMAYDWPGNIRELENFMELIINTESMPLLVEREDHEHVMSNSKLSHFELLSGENEDITLMEVQRRHVQQTLLKYKGNISLAARALGIARNTLYRSIQVHGMECSDVEQCSESEQRHID
jgi:PAS domain S-box-containing protein